MKPDRIFRKIWALVRQSVLIVLLAAAAGLLMNKARADRLPLVVERSQEELLTTDTGNSMVVSLSEARRLCLDKEAVFLDARPPEDFALGHIRCAQNVPLESFDQYFGCVMDKIPDDARIVTYCDGETCHLSEDLAEELVFMGYKNVKVLLNGWTRWREAGFPVETGSHRTSP